MARHHETVDESADRQHDVHDGEQSVRREEGGQEDDCEQEHAHRDPGLALPGDEHQVVLTDDVIRHQARESEDEQEQRHQVDGYGAHGGFHDGLEEVDGFQIHSDDLVDVPEGEDDERGEGADDGVDDDTERLGVPLPDRMGDIGHGGDIGDGSDSGLVREDSALHSDDEHRTDASADCGRNGERIGEDHPEGIQNASVAESDGDHADEEPEDGHGRNDLGREVGDALQPSDDDECCEKSEKSGDDQRVVVEDEGSAEGLGHAAHLHGDESEDVHQKHDEGHDEGQPLHPQSLGDVVGGPSVELAVGTAGLEDLTDGGLQEAGGGPQECEDPHPEDGSGASDEDRQNGAGDIANSYAVPHGHAENMERGELPLPRSLRKNVDIHISFRSLI